MLAVCVLGSATLYASAGDRIDVLSVRRDVAAGQVITAADLGSVSISTDTGLAVVASTDRAAMVGRVAAVELVAGSLIVPGQLRDGPVVEDGTMLVGAVLAPGQYPVDLREGDQVLIVEAPSAAAAATPTAAAAQATDRGRGTVLTIDDTLDASNKRAVSLVVPVGAGVSLATAGAAGRLSLIVVSGQ